MPLQHLLLQQFVCGVLCTYCPDDGQAQAAVLIYRWKRIWRRWVTHWDVKSPIDSRLYLCIRDLRLYLGRTVITGYETVPRPLREEAERDEDDEDDDDSQEPAIARSVHSLSYPYSNLMVSQVFLYSILTTSSSSSRWACALDRMLRAFLCLPFAMK